MLIPKAARFVDLMKAILRLRAPRRVALMEPIASAKQEVAPAHIMVEWHNGYSLLLFFFAGTAKVGSCSIFKKDQATDSSVEGCLLFLVSSETLAQTLNNELAVSPGSSWGAP
jgi:hypothetical protein